MEGVSSLRVTFSTFSIMEVFQNRGFCGVSFLGNMTTAFFKSPSRLGRKFIAAVL